MEPLVSVVIPNWNGKKYLKDCIASLKIQTCDALEIIVVDNASSDGSVEYLEQTYPDVVIIRNKTNPGCRRGHPGGHPGPPRRVPDDAEQ
jgi:glycosyltransferase involved in cell wall biosynthesis